MAAWKEVDSETAESAAAAAAWEADSSCLNWKMVAEVAAAAVEAEKVSDDFESKTEAVEAETEAE